MKTDLSTYPKKGTHWQKNVWHERIIKELQELFDNPIGTPHIKRMLKEILGQ